MPEPIDLDAEDSKLLTLARGARARVSAPEGAAVRDETGRTYSGATVDLPGLAVSALALAVAQAAAAGARSLEAAVLVAGPGRELTAADRQTATALGAGVVLLRATADATVVETLRL